MMRLMFPECRRVLVPQSQDGTPRSIQDSVSHEFEGGHSRFASGAGDGLMESDGVADHPNPDDVGVSDTESVGGASSASASEEAPDIVEPRLVLRDVRENSREMRAALVALDAVDLGTVFASRASPFPIFCVARIEAP